ncbi:hypothetical protein GIB67_040850 [Kingdonia uniflora]|uniref:Uncharacterized protein n=1 Tax=Kingdonia uniflora TaxID=39325 RepID=A0A7J7L856_9MAGN|nr:hypothetical protein GIB67_040850 [Kingdonia uniflora]
MGKEPTHQYLNKMKRTTKLLAQEIAQNASEVFHSTDDNRRTMQQSERRSIQIPSHETTPQGESSPHPANPGLQDGTGESAQILNGKNLMTEDTLHNFRALAQCARWEREKNTRLQSTESTPSIGLEPKGPPQKKIPLLQFLKVWGKMASQNMFYYRSVYERVKNREKFIKGAKDRYLDQLQNLPKSTTLQQMEYRRILFEHNPFARIYRLAYKVLKEAPMVIDQDMNIQAHLHYASRTDRRRYNLMSIDEIAVILPGDGHEPCSMRDIVVYLKAGTSWISADEAEGRA